MTDPVTAFRPTDELLADEWPAARRVAVLDRVHAAPPTEAPLRRRAAVAAGVLSAAAAAVVAVAVVSLSDSPTTPGPTQAARPGVVQTPVGGLQLLAAHAALNRPAALSAGDFWHVTIRSTQDGRHRSAETWTASDGSGWARSTEADGSVSFDRFPAADGTFDDPDADYLATLPTDPDALETFLRAHVSGSTSTDEAVFEYVQMIVSGGFAPPKLRAAAILVLAATPHITVSSTVDSTGRPATKVAFVDPVYRPGETKTVFFDPQTSEVLETANDDTSSGVGSCPPVPSTKVLPPGYHPPTTCTFQPSHYLGTYTDAGPVGSVPARVRHRAVLSR